MSELFIFVYYLLFIIQNLKTQNATNGKIHFARNNFVWAYCKMLYRISQLCLAHHKRMMGNSIPRFTTTCHNKRSNSLPPPPPPVDASALPSWLLLLPAYEREKKTFCSVNSANSYVIIASIWVGLYWFEATSVALLITLLTGVRVTGCWYSKQEEHLITRTASSAVRVTTTEVMSFPFSCYCDWRLDFVLSNRSFRGLR